mgnify:CR=1 FL=1
MIKLPYIEGFDYQKQPYDEYIQDTIDLVGLDGWELEDLGLCSDNENHIYGLSLGDPNKPTIFLTQTHGLSEWRTCYWIRGFAKELVNPSNPILEKYMLDLRQRFHFYVIPCLNVYGYINNTRWNANRVDLNRNFPPFWDDFVVEDPDNWGTKGSAPFSEVESQIIRDKVQELKPVMFLDFHTWGDLQGGTNHLCAPGYERFWRLGRDIVNSQRITYPKEQTFWVPPSERPTAPNWAATVKSDSGFYPMVGNPESGGGMPEYIQAELGMTMIFTYCWHMYRYMETRSLVNTL